MALSASVSTQKPFHAPPVRQVFIVNHRGVLIDGHSTDRHLIGAKKKWLSLKGLNHINPMDLMDESHGFNGYTLW